MENNSENSIELTLILVPDQANSQFSAFFAQFPEAIAVGDTEVQAQKNLFEVFQVMLRDKKEELMRDCIENNQFISRPVNFVLA